MQRVPPIHFNPDLGKGDTYKYPPLASTTRPDTQRTQPNSTGNEYRQQGSLPQTERKYIVPKPQNTQQYPLSERKYSQPSDGNSTVIKIEYTPMKQDNPYNQQPTGSIGNNSVGSRPGSYRVIQPGTSIQPMSARQYLPYTPVRSVESVNPINAFRDYRASSLDSKNNLIGTPATTVGQTIMRTVIQPSSFTPVRTQPLQNQRSYSVNQPTITTLPPQYRQINYDTPSKPIQTILAPQPQKVIHRQPVEKSNIVISINSPDTLGLSPEKTIYDKQLNDSINLKIVERPEQLPNKKREYIRQMTPDREGFFSPRQPTKVDSNRFGSENSFKNIRVKNEQIPQYDSKQNKDSEFHDSNLQIDSVSANTTQVNSIKNTQIAQDQFQPVYDKGEFVIFSILKFILTVFRKLVISKILKVISRIL